MSPQLETPPPPRKFNITPDKLLAENESVIKALRDSIHQIVSSVEPDTATYTNLVAPLANAINEFDVGLQYIATFASLSPDEGLRDASTKATSMIESACRLVDQNEDLFTRLQALRAKPVPSDIDDETQRLVEKWHRNFISNGLELPPASRERMTAISEELSQLRLQFTGNLGDDPGSVWKTDEELEGLAKARLDNLPIDNQGRRRIHLKKPDAPAVTSQCSNAQTRKDVYTGVDFAYADNVELFKKIMALRDERARLDNNNTFASRKLKTSLIKGPQNVNEFLKELRTLTRPLVSAEMKAIQEFAATESPINTWDFDYYHNKMLKEKFNVDHELVSEYFPAPTTISRMLSVFEELFGLTIKERSDRSQDEVWHPDVKLFSVWDTNSGKFIAYLYTDIYPRPGKYNHAANFNIYPGYLNKDGEQLHSGTALVCNASRPNEGMPALLKHSEVITIFHELGHAMHDLLGRTRYTVFHGHRTVNDFTEAPSQLLEFWCWVPESVKRLSCHYSYLSDEYKDSWRRLSANPEQQPPKELPDALISDLIAAKKLNSGILVSRQIALAMFDISIHNPESHEQITNMRIGELYNTLYQELTDLKGINTSNGHVVTPHFIWGVESSYYSYLYTRCLAADMWKTCFEQDPMNKETAQRYRKIILGRGGSKDELENLTEFLGRPPTLDAFLQDLRAQS